MATSTCGTCQAHEDAYALRKVEYLGTAHRAALKTAEQLEATVGHQSCSLDPKAPITDRMLLVFA